MYADKLSLDGLEQFIASASFDPPPLHLSGCFTPHFLLSTIFEFCENLNSSEVFYGRLCAFFNYNIYNTGGFQNTVDFAMRTGLFFKVGAYGGKSQSRLMQY